MTKQKAPAFQFYPSDFLSDGRVAAMTDEETGVYIRLLCHAWIDRGIPADPKALQRMTRISARKWRTIWPAISPCWTLPAGGDGTRLVQERMERTRQEQEQHRARSSAAGKRSAAKRAASAG